MTVSLVQNKNTATLPEALWADLQDAHQQLLSNPTQQNGTRFDRLIGKVGKITGISLNTPNGWNRVIQFLDESRPAWRGYKVDYSVSQRDAA